MPKPQLGQIAAAVVDPLLSDNFSLNIPSVPSGDSTVPLLMLCRTATKPGMTLNQVEVQLFGHTLEYAGNLTYNHDLSVEYVENRSMQIHKILEAWMLYIRAEETQHGAYASEYYRNADFTVYDNKGNVVREYTIHGLWPSAVQDLSFDGTSANSLACSVTFKFNTYSIRR